MSVESKNDDWENFVIEHGYRARLNNLSKILSVDAKDIERVRATGACKKHPKAKDYNELFTLHHGRAPTDEEWPKPLKFGSTQSYEWQAPEIALLISLTGRIGPKEIAEVLTKRLREVTDDEAAERNLTSIHVRTNSIGMQTRDLVGGITTAAAGKEIGSVTIVNQMIRNGQLKPKRIGRHWVIPYAAWKAWKAKRTFPPEGYIQLSSIRVVLGIKSDKLSEFARMGYVPTAVRCNPYGTKAKNTQFGTWYIDRAIGDQLVADRHAGKAMPWHGKPLLDNLKVTYKLWLTRKHPKSCKTCQEIWGKQGAPKSFEDYEKRYAPIAHGAKRHLTMKWSPGLTLTEVAQQAVRSVSFVKRAIESGMLAARVEGRKIYVTKTDATRWIARRCPTGDSEQSWISVETAQTAYLFTLIELNSAISDGTLTSKIGTLGTSKGVTYVSKHQCANLRETRGFTEEEAAKRAGVTVEKFRILLEGVNWRKCDGIPLVTVQAVIKRLQSREGYTVEEAAEKLGATVSWVLDRKKDGTIRVLQTKWDGRRVYMTEPMFQRLKIAFENPKAVSTEKFSDDWLRVSEAAQEAGVTNGTITKWASDNELPRKKSIIGWRYHREAVRARAREYWKTVRFHRAVPPDWLQNEVKTNE